MWIATQKDEMLNVDNYWRCYINQPTGSEEWVIWFWASDDNQVEYARYKTYEAAKENLANLYKYMEMK